MDVKKERILCYLTNQKQLLPTLTYNHNGFTLAEVLITLVIIGVVAALTVPNLINNHRKTEVETKLKSTYSILVNMFKAAEADYGTFGTWDFDDLTTQVSDAAPKRDAFISKYMVPYLKVVRDKTETYESFGYKKISRPNGSSGQDVTQTNRFITLANGISFWSFVSAWALDNDKKVAYQIYIYTDIDGPKKGTNTVGKDIFVFQQMFLNGFPLTMPGERSDCTCRFHSNNAEWINNFIQTNKCTIAVNMQNGAIIFTDFKQSRETILENCKNSQFSSQCGALIRMDGWRIADDYPWL